MKRSSSRARPSSRPPSTRPSPLSQAAAHGQAAPVHMSDEDEAIASGRPIATRAVPSPAANDAALRLKLKELTGGIDAEASDEAWIETLSVTAVDPLEIDDAEDDLKRELGLCARNTPPATRLLSLSHARMECAPSCETLSACALSICASCNARRACVTHAPVPHAQCNVRNPESTPVKFGIGTRPSCPQCAHVFTATLHALRADCRRFCTSLAATSRRSQQSRWRRNAWTGWACHIVVQTTTLRRWPSRTSTWKSM